MQNNLTDFINEELLPKVLSDMDTVFPERKWSLKGSRWSSPYHTDGSESHSGASERSFIITSSNYRYRVGETDGGESMGLIDYALIYQGYSAGARGEAFTSTIKYLCDKVGLEMPERNSEEYERYKAHQEVVENLYARMQKELFTEEGGGVLTYLHSRGYSDELVKKMGLGFISESLATEIKSKRICLSYNPEIEEDIKNGKKECFNYYVGKTHQLVIPYISNGHIRGFKFREIQKNYNKKGQEVSKYMNNTGLPKSLSFFGAKGLYLSGDRTKDLDITIVEGELDALHAQVLGLENVVAAAGGDVSDYALENVKKKGVVRVTLLFDTEATNEGQRETYKKVEKAIRIIRSHRLTPMVAELPSEGGKMDVDDYLKKHSVDELRNIINYAVPASLFLFRLISLWAIDNSSAEDGSITFRNLDEYKRQTIKLANDDNTTPSERDLIFREFEASTNQNIRYETIKEEAELAYDEQKGSENQSLCEREVETLLKTVKRDGWKNAIEEIDKVSNKLKSQIKTSRKTSILDDDSDEIFDSFKQKDKVINSSIELSDGKDNNFRFVMPAGGITVIAAATGHGKSKMLQNIILDIAQNREEGIVLYITYEESRKSVTKGMLNMFANLELTRKTARSGNMQTITRFLNDGSTKFMKSEVIEPFKHKMTMYRQLLKNRKLKAIRPESNSLDELLNILNEALNQNEIPVKGIFIDYIQEVYLSNTKYSRSDELKEVMVEVDLVAQRYNIPIVVGAQLNRDTTDSPLTLSNQAIADSAWIERKATEILQIWSNKEKCKKDPDGNKTKRANEAIQGLDLGTGGKMYLLLTKSRNIPTGVSAILNINGNTGKIEGNFKEEVFQAQLDFPDEEEDDEPF